MRSSRHQKHFCYGKELHVGPILLTSLSHLPTPMPAGNTKLYIPLAGGADDGWSTENEATATCYCGAVQLVFVSSFSHALLGLKLLTVLIPANQRTWPGRHLRLPLHRLSQNHSINVCIQLYCERLSLEAH